MPAKQRRGDVWRTLPVRHAAAAAAVRARTRLRLTAVKARLDGGGLRLGALRSGSVGKVAGEGGPVAHGRRGLRGVCRQRERAAAAAGAAMPHAAAVLRVEEHSKGDRERQ